MRRRLLLDTNVVVWLLLGDREALSPAARKAVEDEDLGLVLSAVTVWEIAIKRSIGKLDIEQRWFEALTALDLEPLPVNARHAAHVEELPWHHRDPFDRLLVAQAVLEGHALVTADDTLRSYGVDIVW